MRGYIAGAAKTVPIDEGLKENRTVPVAGLPGKRQLLGTSRRIEKNNTKNSGIQNILLDTVFSLT